MSHDVVMDILDAVNLVLLKRKAVIDSFDVKETLVSQTVDITLKIRDLTDEEIRNGSGGK